MQFFERDGLKVAHEAAGSGPVLICVHGGGGIAQSWRPVSRALQGGFTVVCPNMTGVAGSSGPPDSAVPEIDHEVRLLEAVARQFGEPVYLVGHSYGASIVISTALRDTVAIAGVTAIEFVPLALLREAGEPGPADDIEAIIAPYIADGAAGEKGDILLFSRNSPEKKGTFFFFRGIHL